MCKRITVQFTSTYRRNRRLTCEIHNNYYYYTCTSFKAGKSERASNNPQHHFHSSIPSARVEKGVSTNTCLTTHPPPPHFRIHQSSVRTEAKYKSALQLDRPTTITYLQFHRASKAHQEYLQSHPHGSASNLSLQLGNCVPYSTRATARPNRARPRKPGTR